MKLSSLLLVALLASTTLSTAVHADRSRPTGVQSEVDLSDATLTSLSRDRGLVDTIARFSARKKAIENTIVTDASGRLRGFTFGQDAITLHYEGDRLASVALGDRILRIAYSVSDRTGQPDALVLRGSEGTIVDVVRTSAVLGYGKESAAFALKLLPFEQLSTERLRTEFDAQRASESEQRRGIEKSRKRCADSTDCDVMRDLQMASCDHAYEQEMALVDYLRSTAQWPASIVTNMLVTALAARASDKKLMCRQSAISEWMNCVMGC